MLSLQDALQTSLLSGQVRHTTVTSSKHQRFAIIWRQDADPQKTEFCSAIVIMLVVRSFSRHSRDHLEQDSR